MRNTYVHERIVLFLAVGLLAVAQHAVAQSADKTSEYSGMLWQAGLNVSGLASVPSSSFTELPGVVNCLGATSDAKFTGGSGGGFSVALVGGLKPTVAESFGSHVGYALRLGYATGKTSFETQEKIGQSIDRNGTITPDIDTYTIDATLSSIRIEPMAYYQMSSSFPLLVEIGANVALLTSATYEQRERITSPSNARFIDGTTERNVSSGDIGDKSSLGVGLSLGLGYDLPLSNTISIRPEVAGLLALTSPVSGVTWSPHELRFGISLMYTAQPSAPTPLEPMGGQR